MQNLTMWLEKVSGSDTTRRGYSDKIEKFGDYVRANYGMEIENFKELYRNARYTSSRAEDEFLDQVKDIVDNYLHQLKVRGLTVLSLSYYRSVAVSYLKKGCGMKALEIDSPKHLFVQYHNRDITKEEIRQILEHASLRDRVFFLMMAESGLRPNTLLQLRYEHIKEDYEANRVPMKINLPSSILKDRISARFSFIGEDALRLLKEYLGTRERLQDNDLLYVAVRPGRMKSELVPVETMSNSFNRLIQKLGLDTPRGERKPKQLRLYVLRKYFFNNMKGTDSAFRNFWFCHTSVDDHYISQFGIDRHREEYLKGYPNLKVFEPSESGQMKLLDKKLADANKTIEELQQQIKQKDANVVNLQSSLSKLEERTKLLEEFWKGIGTIRHGKITELPDGTLVINTKESEAQK